MQDKSLEDAARAYLVEHGWHKESNTFAYQAVVNRMAEFARQQRREAVSEFVRKFDERLEDGLLYKPRQVMRQIEAVAKQLREGTK